MINDAKKPKKSFKIRLLEETLFFFIVFVFIQVTLNYSSAEPVFGKHPVWFLLYSVVVAIIGALGNMYIFKKFSKKSE